MKKNSLMGIGLRYRLTIFFLGLLVSGVNLAQESGNGGGTSQLMFGPKLGAVISSFSNEQPHENLIMGVSGGAFVSYSFTDNVAIQVEGLYEQTGGRQLYFDMPSLLGQEFWYYLTAENQKLVVHNINLPVLFKYSMPLGDAKLVGLIGPKVGYAFSAVAQKESTVFTEVGSFHTYTENEDVYSNVEKINVAATAGLGIEIPTGNYTLLIEGRYNYGITPVYKSYSYMGIPQIAEDLTNHSVCISIGLGF